MTTPSYTGGSGATGAGDSAKEQARQAAGTAAEQSKHVADVARGEAQNVAAEARQQAHHLMDEARSQLDEQSRAQRDRLVGTLRTFSDDLEQMASQGERPGMASDLARQVAGKTRDLASHLDGREPSDLLEEVRGFARNKPGMFLLGAVAAGVVAGRLSRGAKDARSGGPEPRGVYDDPRGTAAGRPTAGTGYPATDPAYPEGTAGTTSGPLDPAIGAPPATPPGAMPGTRAGDQPFADDPARRGAL